MAKFKKYVINEVIFHNVYIKKDRGSIFGELKNLRKIGHPLFNLIYIFSEYTFVLLHRFQHDISGL